MRCYLDASPCDCDFSNIEKASCPRDIARGPLIDEDGFDPFRAGELGLDEHLVYLNGLAA